MADCGLLDVVSYDVRHGSGQKTLSHWGILVEGVWERARHLGQSAATRTRTSRDIYRRNHGGIDVAEVVVCGEGRGMGEV